MASILVVNNKKFLMDSLITALKFFGFDVLWTTSGENAIRLFAENPKDIVIIDLNASDKIAMNTIVQLLYKKNKIKVIVLYDAGEEKSFTYKYLAKSIGAWRVLDKPIKQEKLIETVNQAIKHSGI